MNYNKHNFYRNTFCVFQEVNKAEIQNKIPHFISKSGSQYFFSEKGVYRIANHWGRASNCCWRLQTKAIKVNQLKRIGFAAWKNFYPNNKNQKLFYIVYNPEINQLEYHHKYNPNYDGLALLRNAIETAKTIRQCQELLQTDKWAKYLEIDNLEELRQNWLQKLITTDTNLLQLKREILRKGKILV